ncbi:MAG: membrane protein insertase YidC [Gemmatimonadota bacterium]|jgi:YidC/Oxa1 family membrane protein insertase
MNTEVRFLLAIGLMLVVLVGTNLLFPPERPEVTTAPDSLGMVTQPQGRAPADTMRPGAPPAIPQAQPQEAQLVPAADTVTRESVTVESPLYRYTFSNVGAELTSAELLRFKALNHGGGVVNLIPEGVDGVLGQRLLVGRDTVDLRGLPFQVSPAGGLHLTANDGPQVLRFVYQHPTQPFRIELDYQFHPDQYQVSVNGRVTGVERPLLITDLGEGLAYAEADSSGESRAMAFVANSVQDGIKAHPLGRAKPGVEEGPLLWAAFKNKFFVFALLSGASEVTDTTSATPDYLGGLLVSQSPLPDRVHVEATQSVHQDGTFGYRLFMGPQEYARLSSLGEDMQEVNPYGWRFFRPIVRPFVSVIVTILNFLHNTLSLGYGWVLIVFGVLMRVVLWPLNQKAMRAQLKNMAVQPLMQEIQSKYKDNPERLQKEMMKLYKEHGFNPLAGCWPMMLPYPVLIALFFVFQNSIELRGVSFLWLPDLSAPDPLYILPIFMALSMFAMQWVSMKSLPQTSGQTKAMMYFMPVLMLLIFFRLASGLNLYYATANIATIPQQIWINNERKKVRASGMLGTTSKKE